MEILYPDRSSKDEQLYNLLSLSEMMVLLITKMTKLSINWWGKSTLYGPDHCLYFSFVNWTRTFKRSKKVGEGERFLFSSGVYWQSHAERLGFYKSFDWQLWARTPWLMARRLEWLFLPFSTTLSPLGPLITKKSPLHPPHIQYYHPICRPPDKGRKNPSVSEVNMLCEWINTLRACILC
jgi:hypothetical protein